MANQPSGTLELIAKELAAAFEPIEDKFAGDKIRATLASLGLRLPENLGTFGQFVTSLTNLVTEVARIPALVTEVEKAVTDEDLGAAINSVKDVSSFLKNIITDATAIGTELKNLSGSLPGVDPGQLTAFADELPRRIFEYLVVYHLEGHYPVFSNILNLGGLITYEDVPGVDGNISNPAYTKRSITLSNLSNFFGDPAGYFKTLYGWGDPAFDGKQLFTNINKFIGAIGLPVIYHQPILPADIPSFEFSFLTLQPLLTGKKGLQLILQGDLSKGIEVKLPFLRDNWFFDLVVNADIKGSTTLILDSGGNIIIKPPSGQVAGDLTISFIIDPPEGQSALMLLGESGGSRITLNQLKTGIKATFTWNSATNQAEGSFAWETALSQCKVVIDTSNSDGFIGKLLGNTKIEGDFDLLLGISTSKGVYFQGSGALEIQLPTHIDLGPLSIDSLTLMAGFNGGKFPISIGANMKAALGPLTAVVQNIGVTGTFSFPPGNSGNLGPVQLDIGFKPPDGAGLSIDAAIVQGGGFLYCNPDKGEYAGVLELSIAEIVTVKAIGIITTIMPDGTKGFSLLVIITAEFGTGIQLGFGFTLIGLGGLLGLNRTMLLEPLAAGVKTGAINSIMFPTDPVANAPRIISDLRTWFPPKEGTFLIGPMLKIGWGTPTLISLSFGLIIEIPGNVAIIGILAVALPTADAALIVINVAFIGALEFDKSRVWFFASLFDSRILFMTMEGQMGLLMDFSDNPNFVLSVGGFHPQFNPPPLPFPSPQRIAIDVLRNPLQRISVECYFAVTSNTVQFGASAELFYGIDDFNIHGNFAFDALFQFSPFHFIIDISFSIGITVFGAGLFTISLALHLEGPAPWRASGKATLSIDLWLFSIDISVHFDITWGQADNPALPAIPAIPILVTELNKADNWRAQLPPNTNLLVSLRKLDATTEVMVLHPLGSLRISQRVLPLGVHVDKVGNSPISDAHLFSVTVNSADLTATANPPKEKFAIAQFQNLSDADKLSLAPFQDIAGGVELAFSGRQLGSGKVVKRIVRYELKVIDGDKDLPTRHFKTFGTLFYHWLAGAAITRNSLSYAVKKDKVPTTVDQRIKVGQPTYVVAGVDDNRPLSGAPVFPSEVHARDYLNTHISNNPGMTEEIHVIPTFEAAFV
ncbi:DUF6603 domain-containing protein [Puia sp.]|jgi:hypothetical protein|uniref:DUF6603 domain-containing protein n=1 Tax=Puia sp. TaxID=2045100 RepID=UPI002F4200F2